MSDRVILNRYRRQLAYDHWANRAALESLAVLAVAPTRAVRWLAHILGAQHVWLARLQGVPSDVPVWPDFQLARCRQELAALRTAWRRQLDHYQPRDVQRVVEYTNTKGDVYRSTVGDILDHVVMHSTYHRGQIASAVRDAGGQPAVTDFIHASRTGIIDVDA